MAMQLSNNRFWHFLTGSIKFFSTSSTILTKANTCWFLVKIIPDFSIINTSLLRK